MAKQDDEEVEVKEEKVEVDEKKEKKEKKKGRQAKTDGKVERPPRGSRRSSDDEEEGITYRIR